MYRLLLFVAMLGNLTFAASRDYYPPINLNQKFAVMKLRTYCNACHGVGELRFIHSDEDESVWNYIKTQTAPRSKKLWAEAIKDVLRWPSDAAPSFEQPMDPSGKDWMPRGYKRLEFAQDSVGSQSTRNFILSTLAE